MTMGRLKGMKSEKRVEERIEERIENLPGIQKSGPENHDSLTRALFELYLNRIELFMNYLNHPFYFFWCDGPCSTLFTEEVHHVGCKFVAGLSSSSNVTHFTGRVLVSKRVLITGLQRMICDKKNVVGRREKERRMKEKRMKEREG